MTAWSFSAVHIGSGVLCSDIGPAPCSATDVATSDLNRQLIQRENGDAVFSIRVGLMALRDFLVISLAPVLGGRRGPERG